MSVLSAIGQRVLRFSKRIVSIVTAHSQGHKIDVCIIVYDIKRRRGSHLCTGLVEGVSSLRRKNLGMALISSVGHNLSQIFQTTVYIPDHSIYSQDYMLMMIVLLCKLAGICVRAAIPYPMGIRYFVLLFSISQTFDAGDPALSITLAITCLAHSSSL